ncbi:hypothetical protein PXH78_27005 [Mycolicibacterium smegmatis]|uniref:glycine-rich domain-containing protein n=1 Tax=Mycolicibacterium smegmatis TaxID=1772 RepID=UPI0012FFA3C7|nr:hypothetical protein [Mycolicibacterium smegmatis]MDF1902762.1 hypothetical protein [Mycolicibacterium smegmatis]MDF1909038.1 hypothetical protein [Mycolicibacterium smegmatis]MDF1921257.1 hypothetical protein [Mycolicibacterium smegmatis]MDF1927522.1 hypothetical protein [Mycolicibacterium smegmatis]UAK53377.1 hypothetical protein K8P01_22565 [Mycolicibacterium smegmatis]
MMAQQAEIFRRMWEQLAEGIRNTIIGFIKEVTGIDLETWELFLIGLANQLGLDDIQAWVAGIVAAFQGIDLTPGAILELIISLVGDAIEELVGKLINGGQLINASNLFGNLLPSLFSNVPISALTDDRPNLLLNPDFEGMVAITGQGIWEWDADVGRLGSGSARVEADGTLKALRANGVSVVPGQKMDLDVFILSSGLADPGELLRLEVVEFFDGEELGTALVQSLETPTDLPDEWTGYAEGAKAGRLQGVYTVPSGVDEIRVRLVVTSNATSGTIWWDDASQKQSGGIQMSWIDGLFDLFDEISGQFTEILDDIIPGLGSTIQDALDFVERIVATITGALGGLIPDNPIEDLWNVLTAIPYANVLGIGGLENIGEALQQTWEGLLQGLGSVVEPGVGGIADLIDAAANLFQNAFNGLFLGLGTYNTISNPNTKPIHNGVDDAMETVFPITQFSGADPTNVDAEEDTSRIGFIRCGQDTTKRSVTWYGRGNTNVDAIHCVLWRMNTATGDLALIEESANLVGDVGSDWGWIAFNFDTPVQVQAGEVYGCEVRVEGTGVHEIASQTIPMAPFPGIRPQGLGATRNSGDGTTPSTVSDDDVTYTQDVPWFGFSANVVQTAPTGGAVQILKFDVPGQFVWNFPAWMKEFDVIALGGGGGGAGSAGTGLRGDGGTAGHWEMQTFVRSELSPSITRLTINVGQGGQGGAGTPLPLPLGANGGAGQASGAFANSISVVGDGGAGGSGASGGDSYRGEAAGSEEYNGNTFDGGEIQDSAGGGGYGPGGAGAGGAAQAFWGRPGGNGAAGAVWIVVRPEETD